MSCYFTVSILAHYTIQSKRKYDLLFRSRPTISSSLFLTPFKVGKHYKYVPLNSEMMSSVLGQHTGDLRIEKWNQCSVKYSMFEL